MFKKGVRFHFLKACCRQMVFLSVMGQFADFFVFHRAVICAALGIIVGTVRYSTYIHSIFQGKTHPHVFSWFNWGVIVTIGAWAQYKLHGGPSVAVLAMVAIVCYLIAVISCFRGTKDITRSDWIAFVGALLAIPVWQATHSPVWAIVVLMSIEGLSYYPTVRKTWRDPWSEPPLSYFWAGLRYFFAMLAVPEFTASNILYPIFLMLTDWAFMVYVVLRRRAVTPP
jgi:hypothetical protein